MTVIDHVIFATRDLRSAGHRFWQEHGLASYEGGTHPQYGTGNRIIPLGDGYLEIMGIADEAAARANPLGATILDATSGGDRWLLCCLRPDDIEATAARIGSVVVPGHRALPDGGVVSWRLTGLEIALDERLPFFISWDSPAEHPGKVPLEHRKPYERIEMLTCGGNPTRFAEVVGPDLGTTSLPLSVGIGEAGVQSVSLRLDDGTSVLIR